MVSSSASTSFILCFLIVVCPFHFSSATGRKVNELVQEKPAIPIQFHNGPLVTGQTSVNLIWYGNFEPVQKAIVYIYFNTIGYTLGRVILASQDFSQRIYSYDDLDFVRASKQIFDYSYSLGKSLSDEKIVRLASRGQQSNAINVVLTSADVAVDGFCTSRCGTHGSSYSASKKSKFAYIWVGNSEIQCPGKCASPFLQPIYGLEDAPLVAPNNGVRVDEIFQVINLASVLAQNLVRNIRL